jgi:branched-chain amino acid transport system permease protein
LNLFLELLVAGGIAGAKVGIAALGFALIFYTTREMHFAFGAVSIAAGYVLYWLITGLGGGAVAIVLGLLGALATVVLFSIALHRHIYLRLRSVLPVVMASLGISLIVENVVQIIGGPDLQILSYAPMISILEFGPVRLRVLEVAVFIGFVLIAIALDLFLNHTRLGQGLGATMDDPEMAELVGVRTARMRIGAYAAGAALGGLSGFVALVDTGVKPANGFIFLLYALIITITGRGSLRAVAVWSILFGVLRGLWSWQFSTDLQELAVFALMVSYLVIRDAWDRWQYNRIRPINQPATAVEAKVKPQES